MARRRSFAPAVLAGLIAVALAVVGWLAFSDAPVDDVIASSPDRTATPEAATAKAEAPKLEPAKLEAPAPRQADTSTAARAEVGDAERLELADALWVEGRVAIPDGTPLDEEIDVIADGKQFETIGDHRVRVGQDGRFRVAFSKATKTGWLKLEARYLFLDTPLKLKPSSPPDGVVLEPQLGGCIRGVVVPPAGALDNAAAIGPTRVSAMSWGMNEPMSQRYANVGDDLRFELRGLATHRAQNISFDPPGWVGFSRTDLHLEPGQLIELEIACALGARVRGRIVDGQGEPVGAATVEIATKLVDGDPRAREQRLTQKDGSFERAGVLAGVVTLIVRAQGHLDQTVQLGELKDGDVREGLEIVLDGGAFVAGVVKWDDGQLAAGAFVRVEEPRDEDSDPWAVTFDGANAQRVGDDGRFKISGLGKGPFNVLAQAADGARPEFDEDGKPIKKSKLKGPKWRAEAQGVAAGAEVELVLSPGIAIRGRVVDELGAPVAKATLRAEAVRDRRSLAPNSQDVVVAKLDSADGRFTLAGLAEGAWNLTVTARDFAPIEDIALNVPLAGPLPTIVLTHCASIRGLVVDVDGQPIAKASIEASLATNKRTYIGGETSASSNAKGEFELDSAPSGRVRLVAEHANFARSAPFELDLAPSQSIDGVRIVMGVGGKLVGRIHDSVRGEAKGWYVNAAGADDVGAYYSDSGEAGSFTWEHVTPGTYQVRATEKRASEFNGAITAPKFALRSLSATVEIRDGVTSEVVLGEPTGAAVLVTGRVTQSGSPLPGAHLMVHSAGGSAQAESGADGVYRLSLEGDARYSFNVSGPGGGATLNQSVLVPAAPTFVLDFEFARGRISGRVVDQGGKPVVRASVELAPSTTTAGAVGATQGNLVTGDDGAFLFDGLAALEYQLSVIDRFASFGEKARFGAARVERLSLTSGGVLDGVEVRVAPPAELRVVVRSSGGSPAVGARVEALLPETNGYNRYLASEDCDGVGRATIGSLSTGDYRIVAILENEVGEARSFVHIQSGEASSVEIDLRRGAYLAVSVTDAQGQRVKHSLSIVDANGREWARGATRWSQREDPSRPPSIGPLPPGAYDVRASPNGEGGVTQHITLAAGADQTLALQLTDD